jgi:hypothetical protein
LPPRSNSSARATCRRSRSRDTQAVGRHALTAQAEQLESIVGRIGRRLNHWLRTNRDGVPSADFFEAFRYYQAALLGLLREQRERGRLVRDLSDMPDDELQATIRAESLRAAHTFTPDEWAMLDRVRAEQSQGRHGGLPATSDPDETSDTDE